MTLSLVSNSYIEEYITKIRVKQVPWEGYQRAGHITPEELALIKKVDRQPKGKTEPLLLSDGQTYALLYLGLLKKLQRVDTLQSILVLIADALTGRITLFTRASASDPDLPFGPLLRILETQDDFVQLRTSQILTVLLSAEPVPLQQWQLQPLLNHLSICVQGASPNKRDVAVQCLEVILPRHEVRKAVWAIPGILNGLVETLKSNHNPQMNYQVGFCFWLLTFETEIAEQINKRYDVIPLFISVAQAAAKEKVVRVNIAALRNLVTKAPSANLPAMLVAQLLPFVKNLATRKWSDEDILEDVQFLRDELKARFESLTTWDEYASELTSGHLSWTPVHNSELFWKENVTKLNERDYFYLKRLTELLRTSQDSIVLAVAAHDLGQYVKYHERGKKTVTDLGAKTRVMELMSHSSQEVRYEALLSVQRLVSHPWQSV
ncbi:ATPase V1 complex subunit H [Multifurca ochricompacta]|uniref:V-type proton ATPase subunit H n=1 Tax=Multifurca ochricompacta TaxID=376703 RepID=A0AAD4MAD9_9AGAM|nr:ATPase V1 complex subunit H [Multifurca ochricompacta]